MIVESPQVTGGGVLCRFVTVVPQDATTSHCVTVKAGTTGVSAAGTTARLNVQDCRTWALGLDLHYDTVITVLIQHFDTSLLQWQPHPRNGEPHL